MGVRVSGDPVFAAWLQSEILKAYGLKPWHAGLEPAPLEVRLRAAVNRSRRRKLWQQARRLRIRA